MDLVDIVYFVFFNDSKSGGMDVDILASLANLAIAESPKTTVIDLEQLKVTSHQ